MEYNPANQRFRQLTTIEDDLYAIGSDVNANTNPIQYTVSWDRDNFEMTILTRTAEGGAQAFITAKLGTFTPTAEAGIPADHVEAVIGCNYSSRAQLLRPNANLGERDGAALGDLRRIDQYAILTYKAGPILIGTDFDTNYQVSYDATLLPDDSFGRAPLLSGVFNGHLEGTHDFDNLIAWEQTRPLPGTINVIAGYSNTGSR